jgi:hypothetical protein
MGDLAAQIQEALAEPAQSAAREDSLLDALDAERRGRSDPGVRLTMTRVTRWRSTRAILDSRRLTL